MTSIVAAVIDAVETVTESSNPIDVIKTATEAFSVILDVVSSLIGIVASIAGLSLVHGLRAKQRVATFGFWSQLRMRLQRIHESLSKRPSLLNNMYDAREREVSEEGSPSLEEVKSFRELVAETGNFLNSAPEQMPAYVGWSDDLATVIELVAVVDLYDIVDSSTGFVDSTFPSRRDYCTKICEATKRMVEGIDSKQKKMEKELEPWPERLKRLVSELKK